MRFVKVNNRILDHEKYSRERFIVKQHLLISIYDLAREHGFKREGTKLVNKDLNCKINIIFEKIREEEFV